MAEERKKDFSAGGVVLDRDQEAVLLVRVVNLLGQDVWTFPKGHPDAGEDDQAAALREVLEETGWRCEIDHPITDVHYTYHHDGVQIDKTVRFFLMRPVRQDGVFDPVEVRETRWVPLPEAASWVSYGSDQSLLEKLSDKHPSRSHEKG